MCHLSVKGFAMCDHNTSPHTFNEIVTEHIPKMFSQL